MYKIDIFRKIETSWKTQDMSQNKTSIQLIQGNVRKIKN